MNRQRRTGAEISEIAGDWLAREDAAALTPAQRADLEAWLAAEDRHMGAYLRLRAASARLDRLAALGGGAEGPAPDMPAPAVRSGDRRRFAMAAGIAAAAVLAGGGGYWAWLQPGTYRTDMGEMRRVTLRDGSTISLNTDTVVRVDYSRGRRDIWLRQGEGHFIVAKDRTRPFVVHANGASVTAVGTAFTVRADGRLPVRVVVTEGVVSLSPPKQRQGALVGAMQEAALTPAARAPSVASVSPLEIERRLAWTSGRIALEGQTLAEAAAEFNRYNERKLIVTPEAGAARVGGVFRTSEVEAFARTAAPSLGLSVRVNEDGDIVMEGPPTRG